MVSRLDGPTVAIVKRLVDHAVEVEKKGLQGKVYFDARGIGYNPTSDTGHGYGGYDESLRETAKLLRKTGRRWTSRSTTSRPCSPREAVPIVHFIAAGTRWRTTSAAASSSSGAVAYHIASSEAVSLRNAEIEAVVQVPAGGRRRRDAGPGRRAVHHRLPQAGGVLRLSRHRQIHPGRVLLQDGAVHQLDDGAGRRSALQSLWEDSEIGCGGCQAVAAGGKFQIR